MAVYPVSYDKNSLGHAGPAMGGTTFQFGAGTLNTLSGDPTKNAWADDDSPEPKVGPKFEFTSDQNNISTSGINQQHFPAGVNTNDTSDQNGFADSAIIRQVVPAAQNAVVTSAVNHTALEAALHETPQPIVTPRLGQGAGTKRTADQSGPSDIAARDQAAPNKRRKAIPAYKLATGSTMQQCSYVPTDTNTQHPTIANGGRAPTRYFWGTSKVRQGYQKVNEFAGGVRNLFFGGNDQAQQQKVSCDFEDLEDTQIVHNPAQNGHASNSAVNADVINAFKAFTDAFNNAINSSGPN
jgi:hypothetical protein